eukprot:UN28802
MKRVCFRVPRSIHRRFSSKSDNYVRIVEVGPRDGLQNEKQVIKLEDKKKLIEDLADTGLQTVEAGSFVSPKWVPQMADTSVLYPQLKLKDNVSYPCLTPNLKGLESALKVGVKEVAVFTAASESFCKKNINCTIDESIDRFSELFRTAKEHNIKVRGYVSCVVGCPYEGNTIKPEVVAKVSERLLELGCYEISLGDTIGVGTPGSIRPMLKE